jgi:hypothetical protein
MDCPASKALQPCFTEKVSPDARVQFWAGLLRDGDRRGGLIVLFGKLH